MPTYPAPPGLSGASRLLFGLAALFAVHNPAHAGQDRRTAEDVDTPAVVVPREAGQTANASAGQVGQRQTRATVEAKTKNVPLARIDNRVVNRVQSRVRNRIDRNYDPRANATSPFAVAGERVRAATGPRRR